jgi:hypothetical protein
MALVSLFVMFILFCFVVPPLMSVTTTQVRSAANQTGVIDNVNPILLMIKNVITVLGAICGLGCFVIVFAAIFGDERNENY